MRKIYVTSEATQVIDLGRRRENGATQVIFDLYPRDGYAVTIMVLRPGDTQPYPASGVVLDTVARKVVWTITSTDTYRNGAGSIQYRYEDAHGRVVKTKIFRTFVSRSVDCEAGTPPDAYTTWMESLISQAAQTLINAQSAKQSEDNAKVSEDNAKISEQNAKTSEDNAELSAVSAGQSATSAGQSAESASQSAISASQSASEAENHRITAWGGAISSQEAMHDAQRHANDAKSYRNTAYTYQTNAYTYKESARVSAESASQSAQSAGQSAQSAGASAQSASADAQTASTAAASASTSEANAEHYADLAAQHAERAGYALFDVDESTGEAIVTVSDAVDEAMTFAVNEAAGTLEVTLV